MAEDKSKAALNKAKDFLNKFIEYSENELHIKDNKILQYIYIKLKKIS